MNCPECGKSYIEVRKYTDGDCLYVHAAKLVLGGKMAEVTESCYITMASDPIKGIKKYLAPRDKGGKG